MIILPLTLGAMLLGLVGYFGRAGLLHLTTLRFRGGTLALLACLAQSASVLTHHYQLPLLLVNTVLLLGFCWWNRAAPGFWLVTMGMGLNFLVMVANGGLMPLSPIAFAQMSGVDVAAGTELLFSKSRVLDDAVAALPWLGDRLLLPGPLARLAVWSVGDFILLAGTARLLWMTMKGSHNDHGNLRRATTSC